MKPVLRLCGVACAAIFAVALLPIVLAVACAHRGPERGVPGHAGSNPLSKAQVDRIEPGMTLSEVLAILGPHAEIGPVPCHVVVDGDEASATWFSLAGTERVDLGKPLTRPVESLA